MWAVLTEAHMQVDLTLFAQADSLRTVEGVAVVPLAAVQDMVSACLVAFPEPCHTP